MTTSRPYSRVLIAAIGLVGIAVLVALVSQLWVFFHSGARREEALNLTTAMLDVHTPRVTWLPDDPETGRPMENSTREELMGDYIRAWYQWQLSYLAGRPVGMTEYFTPDALPKATAAVFDITARGHRLHQTDVEHHLQLHFYSADGQIVSFTDHRMTLKQRLYRLEPGEKIADDQSTVDYQVVMLLDDGYWRIKHLVRQPATAIDLHEPTPRDCTQLVRMVRNQFVINGRPFVPNGVNYYPQKTPWSSFWKQYDAKIVDRDFARVRALGLNTVRVFVNFHDFGRGNVLPERVAELQNLLDLASRHGLRVLVTLFDFMGDYRLLNLTATDRQLETLLSRFNRHPALLAWDLKNEPDIDYKHHDPDDVNDWLNWILTRARRYDPNHLITIGWAYPESASYLARYVDFVSFHSYRSLPQLDQDIALLRKAVPNKLLLLEEYGLPSYRGLWAPFGHTEADQLTYVRSVRTILNKHGNIPQLVWTLYDFDQVPAEVVGKKPWQVQPQKHFGILHTDGTPKPVAGALTP
ncbi:cellulase family glycosylhydrolase [Spirosoma luteolum]